MADEGLVEPRSNFFGGRTEISEKDSHHGPLLAVRTSFHLWPDSVDQSGRSMCSGGELDLNEPFPATTMSTVKAAFCIAVLALSGALASVQAVLGTSEHIYSQQNHGSINASDTIADTLHLSALNLDGYTALSHPRFPNHRIRVKKSNFCDPTVK